MSLAALTALGRRYARAWCGGDPERVAAFYADDGSLAVNGAAPAVGRQAIAELARSFMSGLPDMHVSMKGLLREPRGTVFHWALMGTSSGPGGKGHKVQIEGYEVWRLDDEGLIAESKGHFDAAEFEFQLANGVDAPRDEQDDPPHPADARRGRSSLASPRRGRRASPTG